MRVRLLAAVSTALVTLAFTAQAASPPPTFTVDPDGTVHADGLSVGVSDFLAPQTREAIADRMTHPPAVPPMTEGIAANRAGVQAIEQKALDGWLKVYDLDIRPEVIGGVQTDVVTPKAGIAPENKDRVLINLHGGGFWTGARTGGQAEAAPMAGMGRIKVVAVDYRMAPEFTYPAASEDVEKVYRELLKTYKPQNIGIYGCSAGGTLTGEATAWIESKGLPRPGAIGVMCSGLMPSFWYGGDSNIIGPLLNGTPPPGRATTETLKPVRFYFYGVDMKDPLVSPALYPEVLKKFPPTLVVTGTRDIAESNALVTHMRLLKAGVDAQLLVLEGLGHGQFDTLPGTPDAADAYQVIWSFFDKHLGK